MLTSTRQGLVKSAALTGLAAALVLPMAAASPAQAWWRGGWGVGEGYLLFGGTSALASTNCSARASRLMLVKLVSGL